MSEAALNVDPVAYPKLTDTNIDSILSMSKDPNLAAAVAEYEERILRRQLMRLVGNWDLPRAAEDFAGTPVEVPQMDAVIDGVHATYWKIGECVHKNAPLREVTKAELRCQVAAFHYGM